MISSATSIAVLFDIVDIAIGASVVAVFAHYGMFRKGNTPRVSRVLMVAGISVTGLFCLADLFGRTVLPKLVGAVSAQAAMAVLHLDVQRISATLSLTLIAAGLIIMAVQRQRVESTMRRNAADLDRFRSEISRSESRFRSLIQQTPDAVYCLEFVPPISTDLSIDRQIERVKEGVVVECNQVFASSLSLESPDAAIGSRFADRESTENAESHDELYRHFVNHNYRLMSDEFDYIDRFGVDRALRISLTGVVQGNSLVRIWGAETDIRERRRMSADLDSRRSFQAFVAELSSRLISVNDKSAGTTLVDCLRSVSEFLGSDRAAILWFDLENLTAEASYYWNEHGGPPWVELSIDCFPCLGSQLLNGRSVRINSLADMTGDEAVDHAGLRELGLKSFVAVPLMVSEDALGILAIGDITAERNWSDQDLTDIRVIAELFANIVVRINARRDLDIALDELRQAKEQLEAENVYLRQEISSAHGFSEIFGESPQLRKCLNQVQQVAETAMSVLIQGETGTGKELIARAIHNRSRRADRALVKVNCAALPSDLIETELFGHEKGAFTGAHTRKRGRFELANKGTLFLDEIGDLPIALQGKLLRVIQEGEFQRLGGTETIKVDVRLIAATNRDLLSAVDNGEFRADLYYRINTFPIDLPRLAERDGDVPILALHFATKQAALLGKDVTEISATMMEQLVTYDWPGNVRELESVIQRALISATGPVLELPDSFSPRIGGVRNKGGVVLSPVVELSAAERSHIEYALKQAKWVIGGSDGAAEKLGIPASTLRSKMKRLGISRPTRATVGP